jgi:hypothetical protein
MLLGTDSLVGREERSFDSLHSLRIRILIGFEERSFTPDGRSGQTPFLGCLVNNKIPTPLCFS